MLYAPLAVERLGAAVCVLPAYAAKPTRRERGSRRGPSGAGERGARALTQERAQRTLRRLPAGRTAAASRRPGEQPPSLPTPDASPAMGSLPQRPDPRHTARPVKDRSTYPGSAATHEGRGGTLPPHGPPATASASSGARSTCDRGSRAPKPGGPDLDAGALRHYITTACKEVGKTAEDPWQERHSR
jgi:hypothetical protein